MAISSFLILFSLSLNISKKEQLNQLEYRLCGSDNLQPMRKKYSTLMRTVKIMTTQNEEVEPETDKSMLNFCKGL